MTIVHPAGCGRGLLALCACCIMLTDEGQPWCTKAWQELLGL